MVLGAAIDPRLADIRKISNGHMSDKTYKCAILKGEYRQTHAKYSDDDPPRPPIWIMARILPWRADVEFFEQIQKTYFSIAVHDSNLGGREGSRF